MGLINIEHDIELTDVAKVSVERLNHEVNQFENTKFVLLMINADDEVE
jgi:hypothetical protein